MVKKSVTSMELRKLNIKLCNEDKLSIGNITKTVGKSKSVIHSIFRKLGHVKPRNHLAGQEKLLQGKTEGLVMNQKRIDLQQQPLSLKDQMLTLALKYQGTLFPEDLMK